jgi:hypothetical protein
VSVRFIFHSYFLTIFLEDSGASFLPKIVDEKYYTEPDEITSFEPAETEE